MKKAILTIAGMLCMLTARSQVSLLDSEIFREDCARAAEMAANMDWKAAKQQVSYLKKTYPDHPAPHVLAGVTYWWQIQSSTNCTARDSLMHADLEQALSKTEKLDAPEEEKIFMEFLAHALYAQFLSVRDEYVDAVNHARKCLPLLSQMRDEYGELPEFQLPLGLYDYFAETYPDRHPIVKPFMIFFPDGDKSGGLEKLNAVFAKRLITTTTAGNYLAHIYLDYENDYANALRVTKRLNDEYPQNTLFELQRAAAHFYMKEYAAADKIVEGMLETFGKIPDAYIKPVEFTQSRYTSEVMMKACYYKGRILMERDKQYRDALKWLSRSQKLGGLAGLDAEDEDELAGAAYYKGICYQQMGECGLAKDNFALAASMENGKFSKKAKDKRKAECP